MSLYIARVTTSWVAGNNEYHPAFHDDYGSVVESWSDITGQPSEELVPGVNLYDIEVICDAVTLATIEADNDYLVWWSEEVVDAGP